MRCSVRAVERRDFVVVDGLRAVHASARGARDVGAKDLAECPQRGVAGAVARHEHDLCPFARQRHERDAVRAEVRRGER